MDRIWESVPGEGGAGPQVICSDSISTRRVFSNTYLNEHLALGAMLGGGAEDGHGLAVAGELQGELLLHQLFDHLVNHRRRRTG